MEVCGQSTLTKIFLLIELLQASFISFCLAAAVRQKTCFDMPPEAMWNRVVSQSTGVSKNRNIATDCFQQLFFTDKHSIKVL